jgi:CheY-like chemotaxis protein
MISINDSSKNDVVQKDSMPHLLVLDDEVSVRKLIVRILSRENDYIIHETSTVGQAYEAAQGLGRLDVWVTDANVDGSDATLEVQRFRTLHPQLAIVLVSGCEPEVDRRALLSDLGVIFLAKPFSPVQLRQAVDLAQRRGNSNSAVVSAALATTHATATR